MSDYRQFFKRERLKKGLSQRQLGLALGFSSEQKISEIERGKVHYPLSRLPKLTRLFGLDLDQVARLIMREQERIQRKKK